MKVTNITTHAINITSAKLSCSVEPTEFINTWAKVRGKNTSEALSKMSDSSERTEARNSNLQKAIIGASKLSTHVANGIKAEHINAYAPKFDEESTDFSRTWARVRGKNTNEELSKLSDSSERAEARNSNLQKAIPDVSESSTRAVNEIKAECINAHAPKFDEVGLKGGTGSRYKENDSVEAQTGKSPPDVRLNRSLALFQSKKKAYETAIREGQLQLRSFAVGSSKHTEVHKRIKSSQKSLMRTNSIIEAIREKFRLLNASGFEFKGGVESNHDRIRKLDIHSDLFSLKTSLDNLQWQQFHDIHALEESQGQLDAGTVDNNDYIQVLSRLVRINEAIAELQSVIRARESTLAGLS